MDFSRLTTPQRVSAISIVVVAIAAFLPWVSVFGFSKSGISGDGGITLVLAIAGAVLLLWTSAATSPGKVAPKWANVTLIVLAVLAALVGLLDMNGVAAIGLYLTLFAGIAWVVGAVWQLMGQSPKPASGTHDGA